MRNLFFLFVALITTLTAYCQVRVQGYYRSNGTYVRPHMRSSPDRNPYNNYSYPGNTNPYTGKVATGNPETYLKGYSNSGTQDHSEDKGQNGDLSRYYTPPKKTDQYSFMSTGEKVSIMPHSPLRKAPDPYTPTSRYAEGDYTFVENAGDYIVVDGPLGRGYVSKTYVKMATSSSVYPTGYQATETSFNGTAKTFYRYADSINHTVRVCLYSPILSRPDVNARTIVFAEKEKVVLLADHNSVYCLVKLGKLKGYMNKKFLAYY